MKRNSMVFAAGAALVVVGAVGVLVFRGPADPHSVSGERGNRAEALFDLVGGAESVTVRSAELGKQLYRIATPPDGALLPRVDDDGTRVRLALEPTGHSGPATVDVQLSSAVRWQLRLAGGGLAEVVDFRSGRLGGLELAAGAGRIELSVPPPDGTMAVRFGGGAGQIMIHTPAGAPSRIRFGRNVTAGSVTVDGLALPSGTDYTAKTWAEVPNRYDIEVLGGVAMLAVHGG
jgi:hypothetical protein